MPAESPEQLSIARPMSRRRYLLLVVSVVLATTAYLLGVAAPAAAHDCGSHVHIGFGRYVGFVEDCALRTESNPPPTKAPQKKPPPAAETLSSGNPATTLQPLTVEPPRASENSQSVLSRPSTSSTSRTTPEASAQSHSHATMSPVEGDSLGHCVGEQCLGGDPQSSNCADENAVTAKSARKTETRYSSKCNTLWLRLREDAEPLDYYVYLVPYWCAAADPSCRGTAAVLFPQSGRWSGMIAMESNALYRWCTNPTRTTGPFQWCSEPMKAQDLTVAIPPSRIDSVATAADVAGRLVKHQEVALWQRALEVDDDGVWGPDSSAALASWEQLMGFPVDGEPDPEARELLVAEGRSIRSIQAALVDHGYLDESDIGDSWGLGSDAALRAFQRDHDLDPSGVVDPDVLARFPLEHPGTLDPFWETFRLAEDPEVNPERRREAQDRLHKALPGERPLAHLSEIVRDPSQPLEERLETQGVLIGASDEVYELYHSRIFVEYRRDELALFLDADASWAFALQGTAASLDSTAGGAFAFWFDEALSDVTGGYSSFAEWISIVGDAAHTSQRERAYMYALENRCTVLIFEDQWDTPSRIGWHDLSSGRNCHPVVGNSLKPRDWGWDHQNCLEWYVLAGVTSDDAYDMCMEEIPPPA